jgi:hypothetical protein
MMLVSHYLRAWRWRCWRQIVNIASLFAAPVIGYAANSSFRHLGEVLRLWSGKHGISSSATWHRSWSSASWTVSLIAPKGVVLFVHRSDWVVQSGPSCSPALACWRPRGQARQGIPQVRQRVLRPAAADAAGSSR